MQSLVGRCLAEGADNGLSLAGLEAIAAADRPGFDPGWRPSFEAALEDPSSDLGRAALSALLKTGAQGFDERLEAIASDESLASVPRVLALQAMAKPDGPLGAAAFELLVTLAGPEADPLERLDAAQLLGGARLTQAQLAEMASLAATAGPMELPLLLRAFQRTRDPEVGERLAESLAESPGTGSIGPSELARLFTRFPPEVARLIEPTVERLEARKEEQVSRLAALESRLNEGDAERGRQAFLAGKGACLTCHQVGQDGRAVGPDLSHIGRIRTGRDLLESILYPSESLARDFETFQVSLQDGGVQLGLIQRETADTVYLTNPAGEEIPIGRDTIAAIRPLAMSLMPQGLEQALAEQDLLDLVAFLRSCQ